jgi:hypothetical protein
MVDQNVNQSSIDHANTAERGASASPWWRSLRTAVVRVMDELVMGFGVCGTAVYVDPGESPAHESSAKSRTARVPERASSGGLSLELVSAASEARRLLGDRASEWMVTPSWLLDGMTPAELASSPEGARVVMHELRRASATIHLASGSRASGAKSPSTRSAIVLALGVLTAAARNASADHNVYPPGWNKPDANVAKSMFDFRAGWGWDDYQRYWPDQTTHGSATSRQIPDDPPVYVMVPTGHRYHRLP